MRPVVNLKPMALAAIAAMLACRAAAAPAPALPAYGADPQQTSVSGLSSGAFMATQLQVAYSGKIIGAGIVAGGPYYCAAAGGFMFIRICMGRVPLEPPNAALLVAAARGFTAEQIDPLSNLSRRRI